MLNKIPLNTKIGSTFLLLFGSFLFIKTEPVNFPDSTRYFLGNENSIWQEVIAHTGRNVQTLLFTLGSNLTGDSGTGALIANLITWFLSASSLLYFLDKKVNNLKSKNLYMILVVVIYTSYIIAAWISTILSESIALSFLIPTLLISVLTILGEVEIEASRIWLTINQILLLMSQPLWGLLLLPFSLFALGNLRKYRVSLGLILGTSLGTMIIATSSHALPYENTGLTYKGFESLTRSYFFSLEGRFGKVALGENIENCQPAFDLLRKAQGEGSPYPLFVGFESASKNCPRLVDELNLGKTNSIPNMLNDDLVRSIKMTIVGLYAIGNQEPLAGDTLSGRAIGRFAMDLFVPFGLFMLPGSFFLISSKRKRTKLLVCIIATTIGGLLLYFQVGIEGERHTLPVAIIMGLFSWIVLIRKITSPHAI